VLHGEEGGGSLQCHLGLLILHVALIGLEELGRDAVVGNSSSHEVAQDVRGFRGVQDQVRELA